MHVERISNATPFVSLPWLYRSARLEAESSKLNPESSAEEALSSVEEAVAEAVAVTAEGAAATAKEAASVPTIARIVSRDPTNQASSVKAEAGSSTGGPEAISELQAMESLAGSEAASATDDGVDSWAKGSTSGQPTHIWQRR